MPEEKSDSNEVQTSDNNNKRPKFVSDGVQDKFRSTVSQDVGVSATLLGQVPTGHFR